MSAISKKTKYKQKLYLLKKSINYYVRRYRKAINISPLSACALNGKKCYLLRVKSSDFITGIVLFGDLLGIFMTNI